MDFKSLVSVIIGFCCLHTVTAYLRCIECTHISFDPSYIFQGSQQVYDILRGKYNPACATRYPLDRRSFEQQQQQQMKFNLPNSYAVGETICASLSDDNRCNYIHGNISVNLKNYDVTLKLNMHVRNCMTTPELENKCYIRTNGIDFINMRNFFQDRLAFLSRDLDVTRLVANQCICDHDLCSAEVSSAARIQGFSFVILSLLVSYLFAKISG